MLVPFFWKGAGNVSAQTNLVYNGDFELYDSCPPFLGALNYAKGWINPTANTPDYFNACAPAQISGYPFGFGAANVPNNGWGYQNAHSGYGYAGFFTGCCADSSHEYIETQLLETLQPNTVYCLEAYVSRADSQLFATNNIGFLFTPGDISDYTTGSVLSMYAPQATSGNTIISDDTNWVKISASFTLTTPCDYLTIGRV